MQFLLAEPIFSKLGHI